METRFVSAPGLVCGLLAGMCIGLVATAADAHGHPGHHDTRPDTRIHTESGWVEGSRTGAQHQWLGIPYAAPPVGDLRWRAPQAPAAWPGVRPATAYAAHCPQPDTTPLQYGFPGGQEDCLYLNVHAPRQPGHAAARLPVLVWIHGGAFFLGRSNNYVPTRLVEQGVVVVTLNYRLGALGFLAHPALNDAQGRSGNYALLDQQQALRWVQKNIAAFGGDPRRVTVAGQSAGGASVVTHLASPQARGLFQAAIVQSGGYLPAQPTGAQAQAAGVATAATLGCPDSGDAAANAACLRALPIEAIVARQPTAGLYAPNVDGHLLTAPTSETLASGRFNRVPVLTGATHDEYTAFVGQNELRNGYPLPAVAYPLALQSAVAGTQLTAAQALALYPLSDFGGNASLALSAVVTDNLFVCNGRALARTLAKKVPVYAYEFDDPNAPMTLQPPVSFPYKAAHSTDIQYLFDVPASTLNPAQQKLAANMVGYWTRFVKTGQPNGLLDWLRGDPLWPAYGERDRYFRLAPEGNGVITDLAEDHKCAAWTPDA